MAQGLEVNRRERRILMIAGVAAGMSADIGKVYLTATEKLARAADATPLAIN